LNAREKHALDIARKRIDQAPLIMSDPATLYAENLQAHIRRLNNRMMRQYGVPLKLLIIDYLQLMGSTNRYLSKTERVGLASAAIKTAAKECDIHILALAQLSRAVESRDDKRPQMSDLRDSGEIEQDAANIVFFYRPAYYHEQKRPLNKDEAAWLAWKEEEVAVEKELHLIGAKRRFGSPTTRVARFMAAHQAVRSSTRFTGDEGEVLI
jgi:replicative DNA helicase